MSDHAKLSVTLKAGGNTADPWIVVHADSVDEAGYLIQELLAKGVPAKVKEVSAAFAGGQVSTAQAVTTVQESMPGAQVVSSDDGMWAGMNTQPQYQGPPQQQQQYQQPPEQQLPAAQGVPCSTCNGPTTFKSGTSKSGKPYKGHFCNNNRDHTPVWG